MTNAYAGKPWTLDTAEVVSTNNVYITKMVYTPTTAGDDLLVQANDGSNIWKFKAIAGDASEQIEYVKDIDDYVNGFNLVTIDNGTLYVHVR